MYNRVLSMLKYTGGNDLAPATVGPACARDERLDGEALCLGYGNGVFASGVWV